ERAFHQFGIRDVASQEFGAGMEMLRPRAIPMNLRNQRVQHSNIVPSADERVNQMRANESGATGDQNLQCLTLGAEAPRLPNCQAAAGQLPNFGSNPASMREMNRTA